MGATVKEITALANVPKFLKETGASSTYGQCHNALTWLCVQIKRANISGYNIHLCAGVFASNDHSWLVVENADTEKFTIIDMTVDQFGECDVPYVGPISPGYVMHDSITLIDEEELPAFIERLG